MNTRLWWIGSAVFAILAALVTWQVIQSPNQSVTKKNGIDVVVAVQEIPLRRSIAEADVTLRSLPKDSVPEGVATSLDEVVGKMATVDLAADAPLLLQELITPDEVTRRLALSIPDSKTVVAMPIDSHLVKTGLIRPGDLIDVSATFEVEIIREQGMSKMPETVSLLRKLEVHALIIPEPKVATKEEDGGVFTTLEDGEQTILMALERADAVTLQHLIDVGGQLDVMLYSPDNENLADTVPVDSDYLAERFGIELVREDAFVLTEEYFLNNMNEFVFTGEQHPKPDISKLDLSANPGW